jgi:hypothetical protein
MQPKVTCTQTVDTKVCTVGQSPLPSLACGSTRGETGRSTTRSHQVIEGAGAGRSTIAGRPGNVR